MPQNDGFRPDHDVVNVPTSIIVEVIDTKIQEATFGHSQFSVTQSMVQR